MKLFPQCNLHTHTSYCDGANSPEQIVFSAIGEGLETIGFSGHSYVHFDLDCCMTREQTTEYRREILHLREQYADRISVLLGIEQDYYADDPATDYDFVIGSVHYLPTENGYFAIDQSREVLTNAVEDFYGGDFCRLLAHYYETLASVVEKTDCQIVGHFDLLSKFNEDGTLFEAEDPRAFLPAVTALDMLLKKDVVFEINTGAIARGYRTTPYPSMSLLRYIVQKGGRLTLSSDAHDRRMLTFAFEDAVEYLKSAGGSTLWSITNGKWAESPI